MNTRLLFCISIFSLNVHLIYHACCSLLTVQSVAHLLDEAWLKVRNSKILTVQYRPKVGKLKEDQLNIQKKVHMSGGQIYPGGVNLTEKSKIFMKHNFSGLLFLCLPQDQIPYKYCKREIHLVRNGISLSISYIEERHKSTNILLYKYLQSVRCRITPLLRTGCDKQIKDE